MNSSATRPHYQFDAFGAQRELRERLADFLLDSFNVRNPELALRLRRDWAASTRQSDRLFAPMLVQGAFPFPPDKTPAELQSPSLSARDPERPLHPRTVKLLAAAGIDYPLYEHQVETIRHAAAGKTVILSAGTGSGKTESFLIPVIDRLFWDHELGLDDISQPGIRAMIIYPLNALVNNQVERILELLRDEADLTFAFYTSRLKESRTAAERQYHNLGREVPPDCQIIDRKSLRGLGDAGKSRQGPPHILVTNFSMLEYMLIRPLDHSIFRHIMFDGRPRLRAIVLDEAHVYAGAQAAEIHMLLRRAALRFGTHLEDIQGYATSATLGGDDEGETLRKLAADMFSSPRERVASIVGHRYLPSEGSPLRADLGPLQIPDAPPDAPPLVPEDLQTVHFDEKGNPDDLVRDDAAAHNAARACVELGLAAADEVPGLVAKSESRPAVLLHHVLSRHPGLVELRRWLFEGDGEKHETRYLHEVVHKLFPTASAGAGAERATYALLQLGSLARLTAKRHPYIPARMHLFVRTPAGVWVKPKRDGADSPTWPWGSLTTQPPAEIAEDDPWLRLYLCRSCGCPLLRVWEKAGAAQAPLLFATPASQGTVKMAHFSPDASRRLPDSWGRQPVDLVPVIAGDDERDESLALDRCPHCKIEKAELEDLQLPARAALPALVDGIYPSLGEIPQSSDTLPGGGRRMLAFSDSRQGAARLAVEIERTHDIGVNRQLLWRLLATLGPESNDGQVKFSDLHAALVADPSLRQRAEASAIEDAADDDFLHNLATVSIFEELSTPPVTRGNTLELLGLVEVCYPGLRQLKLPTELRGALSEAAWHDLLATALDYARSRGAVKRESLLSEFSGKSDSLYDLLPLPHKDRFIVPASKQQGVQRQRAAVPPSDESDRTIPLHSTQGRLLNFARRLHERHPLPVDAEALLRAVWDALLAGAENPVCKRWLKKSAAGPHTGSETGLQIDLKQLQFKAHLAGPPFIEPVTGRLHFRSVLGVSAQPDNPHTLRPLDDEERQRWASRHAVRRVRDHQLLGLWSVEHTAQLEVDELEDQERKFREGKRNFMSSSTTMEMGIDLGGLTLVLLANVPPGPANYWQRGGRAGRRTDGSSLVLTLAQPRPHDQRVFAEPRAFLERPIVPPQVRLDSRALLLRHVNAFLLAEFFRAVVVPRGGGNPLSAFGHVGEFILDPAPHHAVAAALLDQLAIDKDETLAEVFLRWLDILPVDEHLTRVVRERLIAGTCLANEPLEALVRVCAVAFTHARDRARREESVLKQQEQRERDRGEGKRDDKYLRLLERQKKHLAREPLLSYLVRNDFLPRFGFPIEVVRLDTTYKVSWRDDDDVHPDEDGAALRMERSLDLALSEYAPGGEVIAKKRVHRVAGLVPNWLAEEAGRATRRYFSECSQCHFVTFSDTAQPQECEVCGHKTESLTEFLDRSARMSSKKAAKERADAGDEEADGAPQPSPVRSYLVPAGFAVKFGKGPRRLAGSVKRMPAPKATIGPSHSPPSEIIADALAMGFTPKSSLFIRSEGQVAYTSRSVGTRYGFGYRICQACGRAAPEKDWDKQPPGEYRGHDLLRWTRKCEHGDRSWDHEVLGIQQSVDAYRVRLLGDLAPPTNAFSDAEKFFLSLAVCMQQAAAEKLAVDPRVLQPTMATYRDDLGQAGTEAVIYDSSGSGLLAHLDEEPLGLIQKVCELLETREFAAFVQFDNQYLVEQGRLDIHWLRRHLIEDEGRRARLMKGSAMFEREGAAPLRGMTPRMAAQSLIDDDALEVSLQAAELDESAFEPGQVLRAVWARAVRGSQRAGRVRLLVGRLPELRGDPGQLLLASRLAQLVELGVELAHVSSTATPPLEEDCWSVLARSPRGVRVLGGMSTRGDTLGAWKGPAFGRAWLKDGFTVESAQELAAKLALEQFEERWSRASLVSADALRPRPEQRQWVLVIPGGDTSPEATNIATILEDRTGLGRLAELGEVTSVTYRDRYIERSAVAMWTLDCLLNLFRYAEGARGEVHCLEPNRAGGLTSSVDQVLGARTPPDDLDRATAMKFREWCEQRSQGRKLQLKFKHRRAAHEIGHQRKLEVAFKPGGRLSRIVALFDHGLDWVRPIDGRNTQPWTRQTLRAEASHIVVLALP
ncbi:DEAD/DEAH box helicase [Nannocystis radixulma]|uniref:DEAD/DEAH box helicase n=1 Tax=Nannocystis radixulma TaxID=2995305 RepID=A0ABT5BPP6_9BACT|nr:DEAD/DEAH box helicase [Nannocystis radixulma]MDC0676077.1 DEAD/DEAH box helicase [Nannocystis radixulma]